jgi:hypothetical protein
LYSGGASSESLVVVHNLSIVRVSIAPDEAEAPLIVDPNAVLPFPVAM